MLQYLELIAIIFSFFLFFWKLLLEHMLSNVKMWLTDMDCHDFGIITYKTVDLVVHYMYLFSFRDFLFHARCTGCKLVTRQWETHCHVGGAAYSGRCHISIFLWHTRHVIMLPFQTHSYVSRPILSKPITPWWWYCCGLGTVDQKAPRHNLISLPLK